MKAVYSDVGLGRICGLFGITRQGYYSWLKSIKASLIQDELILYLVLKYRTDHPKMGVRKLYHLLQPDFKQHGIKIGRDGLFDLLAAYNLLIVKRKRRFSTTQSHHRFRKHPNLIKGITPFRANQIWVSDITYIHHEDSFKYLFLITDAYSKKIVGYCLSDSLDSRHAVKALQDAIQSSCQTIDGLIHHSDRGIQYCSSAYIELLKVHGIQISMTENGDPRENAIAERVNGILKDEYLEQYDNLTQLQLDEAIRKYNQIRPHLSCNMLTPQKAHKSKGILKRKWKNYYKYRVNQSIKL